MGESYFDYLFFDEAGQCEEPLTLAPLVGLLKRKPGKILGSLILAGDPKQLGPIIHSRLACYLGLGQCFLRNCIAIDRESSFYFRISYFYRFRYIYDGTSHEYVCAVPKKRWRVQC